MKFFKIKKIMKAKLGKSKQWIITIVIYLYVK